MKKEFLPIIAACALIIWLTGCSVGVRPEGERFAKIAVDENYRPIIDTELTIWNQSSTNGDSLAAVFLPENEVIRLLLSDSVGGAVLSRKLTPQEEQHFADKGFPARITWVAYDGIAIICHPDNPVSEMDMVQLRSILTGEVTQWNQLSPKAPPGEIVFVFDNQNSGTLRFVKDSVCKEKSLSRKIFGAKDNPDVIDYVSKNKTAIGIIGANWVSDLDRPQVRQFREEVKIMALSKQPGGEAVQPLQYYLRTREYPLCREMYVINAKSARGQESSFAAFVASERGQRIILKSGLVPSNAPTRLVQFRRENVNIK